MCVVGGGGGGCRCGGGGGGASFTNVNGCVIVVAALNVWNALQE